MWAALSLGRILWTQGGGEDCLCPPLSSTGSTPSSAHSGSSPLPTFILFLSPQSPQSSQQPGDGTLPDPFSPGHALSGLGL